MGKGTLVVSLRARGLAAFDAQKYFNVRHHALAITTEVWDLIISTAITGFHLSWSAWVSICITIVAVAVSISPSSWISQVNVPRDTQDGLYVVTDASTSVAYVIILMGSVFLPLYGLLTMVWLRRSSALASMAKLKAHVVGIVLSAGGGDGEGAMLVQRRAYVLLDDLHRYLHHKRPYARHFFLPYQVSADSSIPTSDQLSKVSRELGILLRKLHGSVRDLHGSVQLLRDVGCSERHVDTLARQVTQLHAAVEQLVVIKEMRTPVALRAFLRWATMVMVPVYWSFYAHNVDLVTSQPASIGILSVVCQIMLMAVLDVTMSMEDPFDDERIDNLSVMEAMDHMAAMTSHPSLDSVASPDGYATMTMYPEEGDDGPLQSAIYMPPMPPPSGRTGVL
ncbi:hypothetical protein FOA52_006797 [Chlamydomonas sp. UWO 241]|nr:hypothetical protein FOA52_006797 [Chlamydomonas sp. UWO 241]